MEYVRGVRGRTDAPVRRVVADDDKPFVPLCLPRTRAADTLLVVKEVVTGGRRYVVCRNEAEANEEPQKWTPILGPVA